MRALCPSICLITSALSATAACRSASAQAPAPAAPAQDLSEGALPDPASGEPVSLHEILAWADRHAPEVKISRARLRLGEASREGAAPLFSANPVLTAAAGPRISGEGSKIEASLVQQFEVAGERGLRLEVADRMKARLEAELSESRWAVHRAVHAAFHDALLARERAEVAARLAEFQGQLLDYTRRRFEAGDIGSLPVRITEGETAQAKQLELAAAQSYRAARLRLAEVAGWPARHSPEPAGALDAPRDAPPLARLEEQALEQHPALARQKSAVAEQRARVRRADRDAWPEPALGVSFEREQVGSASEDLLLGVVRIPIPIWRRNQAERAEVRARLAVAQAREEAIRRNLGARLARARDAVDTAVKRVELFAAGVLPQFEESLRLLRRAFELGEVDILDVSVARERLLRIQLDALAAYAAYYDAVAELEAQIGAEVWPEERHH